jgi:hypothetical protein
MGSHSHRPHADKLPTMVHPHDDAWRPAGPGVRPGTKSRLLEARERLRKRGHL